MTDPTDRAALVAIQAACDKVAPDNLPAVVGANNVDEGSGRWVIIGESGSPILDEDDPAGVVRCLSERWERCQEVAERELARANDLAQKVRAARSFLNTIDASAPAVSAVVFGVIRALDGHKMAPTPEAS
jgi:hypothetical protein